MHEGNDQPVIRDQQLFASDENPSLNYFYASNRILPKPLMLAEFFKDFQQYSTIQQEQMLAKINSILERVTTNAYALNQLYQPTFSELKNDAQLSMLEQIIDIVPNNIENYSIFNKLLTVLQSLLKMSSLDQRYMERAISKIVAEFYSEGQVHQKHIFAVILIFKAFFNCKIGMQNEPERMLVFHGGRGLQICKPAGGNQIKWLFSNGLSIYFWINIENIKFGAEAPLPKLFTFYSPNNGGLQCYLIDNKVYYRTLGSKYSQPQIGSNGMCLGQIEPKKWTFFALEHESAKRLLGRSHIIFRLNNKKFTFNLSPPSISSKQKMKIVFFDRVYCRTSSIALFPQFNDEDMAEQLNKNKNSIDTLKTNKAFIFQERQNMLYQKSCLGFCADVVLHRFLQMDFQVVLPLLRLVRYGEKTQYPILNQFLQLFVLYLRRSPQNQTIAYTKNYSYMIAQLIKQLPNLPTIFNQETTHVLLHIKQTITNPDLLTQYYAQFLWPLLDSSVSLSRKQQILQIIKNNFTQNVAYSSTIIGLDQMINLIVSLSTKTTKCCQKHYKIMARRFDKEIEHVEVYGQEEMVLENILKIIELYIHSQKVDTSVCIYKLCRLLCLKYSPCFVLSLMATIKKILFQKINEKINSSQSSKIISFLSSKKTYLIFLHVIENNFFAEIKAESVRILYTLLLKKVSSLQAEEISHRLSRALWKINEENNQQRISLPNSPQKKQKIEEPIQEQEPQLSFPPVKGNRKMLLQIEKQQQNEFQEEINFVVNKKGSIFQKKEDEQIDQPIKQVGPQAPKLSNRIKGNKKFNFSFMSQGNEELKFEKDVRKIEKTFSVDKYNNEIMEEEKTNQAQIGEDPPILDFKPKKGKKKGISLGLNIDTDAINQMYTFGGEKGHQIIISEEEQKNQVEKIRKLAKKCLAAMQGQQYYEQQDSKKTQKEQNQTRISFPPPPTTSNRMLKARQQLKAPELKLIDEEDDEYSAQKPKNLSISVASPSGFSLQSPHYGSKKSSKSPTSMASICEQNLVSLYNSLLQSCLGPNQQIQIPSILCIFFSWIPQTNLEVKFICDLLFVLENDQGEEKIKMVSQMPQLYDFLFELTYKALVFQQIGQKRLYVDRLEELIKKIFSYVFKEDPESINKFIFIIDWATHKAKMENLYDPKCLFLTTRYVFFMIMDAIEADLLGNDNFDKKIERNYQQLGIAISKFCKFIPKQLPQKHHIEMDHFDRVILSEDFQNLPSIQPYFQNQWADYLLCEKYYLLFKKLFATDWYKKTLRNFQKIPFNIKDAEIFIQNIIPSHWVQLTAQSRFYFQNSFIFTLVQICRYRMVEKMSIKRQNNNEEVPELIWQTILLVLFCEVSKQKNQRNNSQVILSFLKNCKHFMELQIQNACIIIPLLQTIKNVLQKTQNHQLSKDSLTNMTGSRILSADKDITSSNSPILNKHNLFVDSLMAQYINDALFLESEALNFDNFKLNFRQAWIPAQNHHTKIKSELHSKFVKVYEKIEETTTQFIQDLTNIIEEETQRYSFVNILLQASQRNIKSKFRKIWNNLRLFGTAWTHPQLTLQNDTLFNKTLFSYERYEPNQFVTYRISKHLSKYRMRYLLDPILIDPTKKNTSILPNMHDNDNIVEQDINLHKALLSYSDNKLLLGKRVVSWLTTSNSHKNYEGLDIMMNFKKVRMIKTLTVRHGNIGIINDKLVFICSHVIEPQTHLSISQYYLKNDKALAKTWPLQFIKQIFKRRYVNRKRAIQIFFIHGKSIMLEFYEQDHEDFIKKILKYKGTKCPNLIYHGHKSLDPKKVLDASGLLKKWSTYELSNFEYLMELNCLAGRSFNDLTQYPVIPWTMINFSEKLILSDEDNYRNLTLPMGALGSESRTEGFRERFDNMGENQEEKFHYGTHYSSPAILYHFLVRISPFTQGAILLQSGKFDFADRMFFSVYDSYKNATSQFSDVRELLPQLYTIPEVYLNINKLDMGVMQSKKRIHNVQLPQWARENPYLYTSKLRKGFEEFVVSKNISKWIDLIFGSKQRGEQAIRNLNRFVHLTYEDSIDFSEIQNQKTVKALETQILNFGQTPSQILTKSHLDRSHLTTIQPFPTICDTKLEPRIYRPSRHKKEDLLKDQKELNAMKQSNESIVYMKWFKDSKLVFIRRNGEMLFYKWSSSQTANKVPFQCAIQKEKVLTKMTKNVLQNQQFFDPSLKVESFPIQFINSGHQVALGGYGDGKLLLLDSDNNTLIETYNNHEHTICCMRSDLKDNFLITGDIYGRVIIWRITATHRLSFFNEFHDHRGQITSIFISYDLKFLFTSSMDGSVFGYNIYTGKKMKVFYHPQRLPINQVIVSTNPLPIVILFCSKESIIYSYSINGQLIQRMHEKQFQRFLSPILTRDSLGFQYIVYGNQNGQTIIRTLPYLDNPKKYIVAKDAAVNKICVSKSGRFVVTGCSDGELSVVAVTQSYSAAHQTSQNVNA